MALWKASLNYRRIYIMTGRLEKKVALVTGAGSGIGRAATMDDGAAMPIP